MTNHSFFISDNVNLTYFKDSIIVRSSIKSGGFSKSFLKCSILLAILLFCVGFFEIYEDIGALLFATFVLFLILFSMKSDLKYLLKFRNLKEELIIDLKTIQYLKNGKPIISGKFDSFFLCFNIENFKSYKPDYDENINKFNPMLFLIGEGKNSYIMQTLNLNECIALLDELEIWYLKNNIIDSLKIYRRSTNEVTLYKNRYWKDQFSKNLFGGIH